MSQQQPVGSGPGYHVHPDANKQLQLPVYIGICLLSLSCFALYKVLQWCLKKGLFMWHNIVHYFAKKDRAYNSDEEEEEKPRKRKEKRRRKRAHKEDEYSSE